MLTFSVIIPVYNSEKYLTQCLESLINQTYKNLEIICIDDCSTDNSFEILQKFANNDSRFKIIRNKENKKAGISRNIGLNIATGDYVHFLDSDDWMDVSAYEKFAQNLDVAQKPDILAFQLRHVSLDGKKTIKTRIYSMPEQFGNVINLRSVPELSQSWETFNAPKVYRREFLIKNSCFYSDYEQGEDIHFCYLTLIKAENIYITNDVLYNYRSNNPRSLGAVPAKNPECAKRIFEDVCMLTIDSQPDVRNIICGKVFRYYFWGLWNNFKRRNITYSEFKRCLINLDEKYLKHNFCSCKWYCYAEEVIHRQFVYVYLKNTIRQILSKYFPLVNKILTCLRNKL